jgi:CDP-diacylglycerol--glycerol-3-phosphate 3-phosphatidyltransferase
MNSKIFNLPNQLTSLRLILAVVMFGFIHFEFYLTSMVLFIVAASTDWLDGYYARKYGQVTTLGRILDPFADKVIVCGTFIFLVAIPALTEARFEGLTAAGWSLRPWMVVVVVGRELLVTALRSFIEERGADFSANMSGKLKMVFQCIAAGVALFYLAMVGRLGSVPAWFHLTLYAALVISIWLAVISTVYSGVIYVFAAVRILNQDR